MIVSKTNVSTTLSKSRLDMIEAGGRICQLLGIPRSVGRIYGLLYLAPQPLSMPEIADLLRISIGSASTGTRLLSAWRAIRVAWVPGHRRDHFEVEPDLTNLLRTAYMDFVKPRLNSSDKRLERISASLDEEHGKGVITQEDYNLSSERLDNIRDIQKKLQSLIPLLEQLV